MLISQCVDQVMVHLCDILQVPKCYKNVLWRTIFMIYIKSRLNFLCTDNALYHVTMLMHIRHIWSVTQTPLNSLGKKLIKWYITRVKRVTTLNRTKCHITVTSQMRYDVSNRHQFLFNSLFNLTVQQRKHHRFALRALSEGNLPVIASQRAGKLLYNQW